MLSEEVRFCSGRVKRIEKKWADEEGKQNSEEGLDTKRKKRKRKVREKSRMDGNQRGKK